MRLATTRVVQPRGTWRTVEEIARLCGVAERVVFARLVEGLLGPARVDERQRCVVAPDDATLSMHFPEYGARVAAASKGWPVADTVNLKVLAAETKTHLATLQTRAEAGHGVAYDGSRTRYVRRSDVVRDTPSRVAQAIASLPASQRRALSHLSRDRWFGPGEAMRRTKASWDEIQAVAPSVEYRKNRWSAWIGDDILELFASRSLAAAVAADPRCQAAKVPSDEFHPLRDAVRKFEPLGLTAIHTWNQRRATGRLIAVDALTPINGVLCRRPFVHIPAHVWAATSRRTARVWFRSMGTRPEADLRVHSS